MKMYTLELGENTGYLFQNSAHGANMLILLEQTPFENTEVIPEIQCEQIVHRRSSDSFVMGRMNAQTLQSRVVAILDFQVKEDGKDIWKYMLLTVLDHRKLMMQFQCDMSQSMGYALGLLDPRKFLVFAEGGTEDAF